MRLQREVRWCVLLVVLLTLAIKYGFAAEPQVTKTHRVLVIHSYPEGEWYTGINRGIQDEARELGLEIQFEPLIYNYE